MSAWRCFAGWLMAFLLLSATAVSASDAPVLRVGAPALPMPYNDELERWTIPTQARIADAVRRVMRTA